MSASWSEKSNTTAEERERAAMVIFELRRKHPCVCKVPKCPFKGLCELCIKNHLEDGTLPACCLPPVSEREDYTKYPDCRTPLLWFLIDTETFKEKIMQLTPELREKIKNNIIKLHDFIYYGDGDI